MARLANNNEKKSEIKSNLKLKKYSLLFYFYLFLNVNIF